MIHHPLPIIFILLSIEVSILFISSQAWGQRYFKFLPPVFWIYFLPMLASSFGLIDSKLPLYSFISLYLLPGSLFLLLIPVDIRAILKLGKPALTMFFAGSLGIALGAPLVFVLFKPWIGPEFWSGFAALCGSWTGGSANMIAVKEALGTPDPIFLPMVIVDTVVPYVWMGILVVLAEKQAVYDRWNGSRREILREFTAERKSSIEKFSPAKILLILALAAGGSAAASSAARFFPVVKDVISTYAWTIILVSTMGVALSFTRLRGIERYGSARIGYFILYFVLTTIGARADIRTIGSAWILIAAGFVLVLFHAAILFLVSRRMKAPLFLAAVASQANVGGVASAPVVAEIYQPGAASLGLLLAILGNIIGTYVGILSGQLGRWLAGL